MPGRRRARLSNPALPGQLHDAPADLIEALINALDIQILYRPEQGQATIQPALRAEHGVNAPPIGRPGGGVVPGRVLPGEYAR